MKDQEKIINWYNRFWVKQPKNIKNLDEAFAKVWGFKNFKEYILNKYESHRS